MENTQKPTHILKEEVKNTPELMQAYEELVEIHTDYDNQLSYIGSLITENDEENVEKGEMLMIIMQKRYEVGSYIVSTFYQAVDEVGNKIDSEGFIVDSETATN